MITTAPVKTDLLCLIPSFAGGGAERVMLRLVSKLKEQHSLVLVVIEPVFDYPLPSGITCHVLSGKGGPLAQMVRFARLLDEIKPATVLSFLPAANFLAVLGSRFSRKIRPRVVISERISQTSRTGLKRLMHQVLVKTVYSFADKVIAVTPQIKDELIQQGLSQLKVVVIPNPIEIEKIKLLAGQVDSVVSSPVEPPFLLGMGRLHPTKGFDLLIEAFSKIATTPGFEKWKLLIVGSGPQQEELTKYISKKQLELRVKLIPFRSNPFPLISAADLFVLSSRSEGFPNILLEAMALGKPCVAFDCPGGPRFVGDDAVVLASPEDTEALAKRIMQLIKDPSMQQQLSQRASQRAQRYELPWVADQYRAELGLV